MTEPRRKFKAEVVRVRQPVQERDPGNLPECCYDVPVLLNKPPKEWWALWRRTRTALNTLARADEDNSQIILRMCDDPDDQKSRCKELLRSIDTANKEYEVRISPIYRKEREVQKKAEAVLLQKSAKKNWKRSERINALLRGVRYPKTTSASPTSQTPAKRRQVEMP